MGHEIRIREAEGIASIREEEPTRGYDRVTLEIILTREWQTTHTTFLLEQGGTNIFFNPDKENNAKYGPLTGAQLMQTIQEIKDRK